MTEAEKIITTATKTAKKVAQKVETADVFSMASVEMPEMFRDAAEKSVKQAKDAYEKMRSAAEEATDLIEDQIETSRSGYVSVNTKLIEAAKANTDATFKFAQDVLAVKTMAEVIELQTSFARKQFELVSAQAKEIQELVTKVATETQAPYKDAMTKMFKDFKAA